jgi:hypothetical protein
MSTYLHTLGKVSFLTGLIVLGVSVYFGGRSESIENAIEPDPLIMKYGLLILLIWVVAILGSVFTCIGLSCDNCHSKLLGAGCDSNSKIKRNALVSFFIPDYAFEKKVICSKCHTEFSL